MTSTRTPITSLDDGLLEAFLTDRRAKKKRIRDVAVTVRQFLTHLRSIGVIPAKQGIDLSPTQEVEDRYRRYLQQERGLTMSTFLNYRLWVRRFLEDRFGEGPIELASLTSSGVSSFLVRHAKAGSPGSAKLMVTVTRSFLRFLFQHGETPTDLSVAVPTVAHWRLAGVPSHLSRGEVEAILDSCDLNTASGRRNHAVLLLLARLGLRACEIVAMQLDDLDWRQGEVTIRGKGKYQDRLPLPEDVGLSISRYLQKDRPSCPSRCVFITAKAPHHGFAGPAAVTSIVCRAIGRAGLHPGEAGARLLRRSLATDMLKQGATLAEIGQVLRHRSANSTEIYAKVDIDGLRQLAQPWPIGGGER